MVAAFMDLRSLYADSVKAKISVQVRIHAFGENNNKNIEGTSRNLYLSYDDSLRGKLIYSDHLHVLHKFRLVTPFLL
jgi:hypothetical protein